jgi:hypothetical protein
VLAPFCSALDRDGRLTRLKAVELQLDLRDASELHFEFVRDLRDLLGQLSDRSVRRWTRRSWRAGSPARPSPAGDACVRTTFRGHPRRSLKGEAESLSRSVIEVT